MEYFLELPHQIKFMISNDHAKFAHVGSFEWSNTLSISRIPVRRIRLIFESLRVVGIRGGGADQRKVTWMIKTSHQPLLV